jgi:hypothetical protein
MLLLIVVRSPILLAVLAGIVVSNFGAIASVVVMLVAAIGGCDVSDGMAGHFEDNPDRGCLGRHIGSAGLGTRSGPVHRPIASLRAYLASPVQGYGLAQCGARTEHDKKRKRKVYYEACEGGEEFRQPHRQRQDLCGDQKRCCVGEPAGNA